MKFVRNVLCFINIRDAVAMHALIFNVTLEY